MRGVNKLKEELIRIRNNNWSIPSYINKYDLALRMLDNIGSTAPELRDSLIYNLLSNMIVEKVLSDAEVKYILELILSEKHLFYNIGKIEDDSVFNRAFSILLIECILRRNNENQGNLFTKTEIVRIYEEICRYLKLEKDVRGYIELKGWSHTAAHTADALVEIAICKDINELELINILEGIKEKVCINYYVYANLEEERLVTTVINIIERKLISQEKIIKWLKSFKNIEKTGV